MDWLAVNLLDGLVTGLVLFMLCSGLTLIFSMLGVLNFAHGAFYMAGAYLAFRIGEAAGFWVAVVAAPLLVGAMGALVERFALRRIEGHVPELVFTFGLAIALEETIALLFGRSQQPYAVPAALDFPAFAIAGGTFPAYKIFTIAVAVAIFAGLYLVLTRTRLGLLVQAARTQPVMLSHLGHDVPRLFTGVFALGTGLAGLAGAIAGPVLGTFPGMATQLASIVFVTLVVGGLGSLWGALVASLALGWLQTFATASSLGVTDLAAWIGLAPPENLATHPWRDLWTMTLPQVGPLLPFLAMVVVLVWRPQGLFGRTQP